MSESLTRLAAMLLHLLGAPAPPRELWRAGGIRRLLRDWPSARPGSVQELSLLLGVADPHVRIESRAAGPGRLHLTVLWRRWRTAGELAAVAPQPAQLGAACREAIAWWKPRGLTATWQMAWPGAPLLVAPPAGGEPPMKTEGALLERFAADFLHVRRRTAVPPRTWVSLAADGPAAAEKRAVVLGDGGLSRFLFNVGPWQAAVHVEEQHSEPGRTELRLAALRRLDRLELLAPPGLDAAEFRLDGVAVSPAPLHRWPEYYSFPLSSPLRRGRRLRLTCVHNAEAAAPLFFNPALFEACRWDAKSRTFARDFRAGGDGPETYRNLARGDGIAAHRQPFPLDAGASAEGDASLFARASRVLLGDRLGRRSDVGRLVSGLFPEVARVEWAEAAWDEPDATMGWLRRMRGDVVRVTAACRGGESAERLRASVERFLRRRLTAGRPVRVEVVCGGES